MGFVVKYSTWPDGVLEGKARGTSQRQSPKFDRVSRVKSYYGKYIGLQSTLVLIPSIPEVSRPHRSRIQVGGLSPPDEYTKDKGQSCV